MIKEVKIVYITDSNYLAPTYISIKSLIQNKNNDSLYRIFVLGRELSDKDKEELTDLGRDTAKLTVIDVNDELKQLKQFSQFYNSEKQTALVKLLLPEIISDIDKILYIDGDTFIRKDVSELYDVDISKTYVAAARDYGETCKKMQKVLGLERVYFNSGVMVMNLKKMREDNISWELLKVKKQIAHDDGFLDQSVYNIVCSDYIELPIKWNFYYNYYYITHSIDWFYSNCLCPYSDKKKMREDSAIIHFACFKPWNQPFKKNPWYRKPLLFGDLFDESSIGWISKQWFTELLDSPYADWINVKVNDLFRKNNNKNCLLFYLYKDKVIFNRQKGIIHYKEIKYQNNGKAPKTEIVIAGIKVLVVSSDERGNNKKYKIFGIIPFMKY